MNFKRIIARDVMTADLLTFNDDTPTPEAIATLQDYGISGAPVLNSYRECVGVFARADIIQHGAEMNAGEAPRPGDFFSGDRDADFTEYIPKDDYDEVLLGRETVGEWMNPNIEAVGPGESLAEVARLMAEKSLHRVLVMEGKKLLGIITALDIVRVVGGVGPLRESERRPRNARTG